jgi:hypothetical protein
MGQTGGDRWRNYGGHRLWHAPEHPTRTYYPDNTPITVEQTGGLVRISQPPEPTTGIGKTIELDMAETSPHVRVIHRLTNHGLWPVECAPWALSVMAAGGTAVVPLPSRGEHPRDLLPGNHIVLWPYTNMADPRWTWGQKYILLRQTDAPPQKAGADVPDGWAAYANTVCLFIKLFERQAGAVYPDLGCNFETFTNRVMLEVETLGPLARVEPGASVEHVEDWCLFPATPLPQSDADVERDLLPHVAEARRLSGR